MEVEFSKSTVTRTVVIKFSRDFLLCCKSCKFSSREYKVMVTKMRCKWNKELNRHALWREGSLNQTSLRHKIQLQLQLPGAMIYFSLAKEKKNLSK